MFEVILVGREALDILELQVLQAIMVPVRTVRDLLVSDADCFISAKVLSSTTLVGT